MSLRHKKRRISDVDDDENTQWYRQCTVALTMISKIIQNQEQKNEDDMQPCVSPEWVGRKIFWTERNDFHSQRSVSLFASYQWLALVYIQQTPSTTDSTETPYWTMCYKIEKILKRDISVIFWCLWKSTPMEERNSTTWRSFLWLDFPCWCTDVSDRGNFSRKENRWMGRGCVFLWLLEHLFEGS